MPDSVVLLGIDPGLQRTGWGVVRSTGNHLSFVACGVIATKKEEETGIAPRLLQLAAGVAGVIAQYLPHEAAIEETFVNVNGQSTLKLGQARGAILLSLMQNGLEPAEYAATLVKKSLTGNGRAEKAQLAHMVQLLLPGCGAHGPDAMDALGIAIAHANLRAHRALLKK